jgi:hypothetical protein
MKNFTKKSNTNKTNKIIKEKELSFTEDILNIIFVIFFIFN